MMTQKLTIGLIGFILLLGGCSSTTNSWSGGGAATIPAEGTFVRHVRIRVAPSHTERFEVLLSTCRDVAAAARLGEDFGWLCYREAPGRYWLVFMNDRADAFPYRAAPNALAGFARGIAQRASDVDMNSINRLLADLEYEVEWDTLHRQKAAWSTVEGMSTSTHPMARMMVRTIRPGQAQAFDEALTARTQFFAEHNYPLPIEGFVTQAGAPRTALQVVFPVDWASFYASESFHAFVEGLDETDQADYANRKAALMETMARAEYYDASHAPELSYGVD